MLGIGDRDEKDCPQRSRSNQYTNCPKESGQTCVIVPTCNYRLGVAGTLKAER